MNTYDIRNKEVINIYDGRSLGFVEDVELNLEKGTIEAIIIPAERGFMGLFPRGEDLVIRWRDIKRIGDDVILVDFYGVASISMRAARPPKTGLNRGAAFTRRR